MKMTVKEREQSILKDFEDLGDEMLIFDYMFLDRIFASVIIKKVKK